MTSEARLPSNPADGNGDAAAAPARVKPPKSRDSKQFWRAAKHLWPYRRIIGTSVVCAIFVGLAVSSSLTTMLPIMNVLFNGQTVADWANGSIAQKRLGAKLADSGSRLEVTHVHDDSAAEAAGLRKGDRITIADADRIPAVNAALSDPEATQVVLLRDKGEAARVNLPKLPFHLAIGQQLASKVSPRPVWAIAEIFAVLSVIAIFGNVMKFFQEYLSDTAAIRAVNDIRRRLYDHILHVPLSHFGKKGSSDVTSRLVGDSIALEAGFKTVLGQTIQQPIVAAMALMVALYTSWKLTLVIILFAPLMGFIIQKFGKKMRRASRAAMQKSSSMLGQIQATVNGIRVVKGASAERFERRRYRSIMSMLVDNQLRMSKIDAFSAPTMETLTLIVVGGVVLIATYMVTESKTLTVDKFFLVMACLGTIADSLRRLSKVNNTMQIANSASDRIFEVMDLPVERDRAKATEARSESSRVKLPPLQSEVRFENVMFTYPNATGPAITDVSLTVPKGQSIAVVGRNGSGKTTLLALLPRFYDVDSGRILIDGVDVRDATLRSLRGQISIVTQESVIFPGTIAENIAYGQPNLSRDLIEAAAKRAFAHDFIMEKPSGYDTMLGEMGGQLSGGQRQRICIARAILRNAPILILDEATSQVDAESEHLIQQAIDGLMHERMQGGVASPPTTFVIAHRFSTILGADTIVVMDRGQIVGQGKHDELLRTCETYQQLYERQLFAVPAA